MTTIQRASAYPILPQANECVQPVFCALSESGLHIDALLNEGIFTISYGESSYMIHTKVKENICYLFYEDSNFPHDIVRTIEAALFQRGIFSFFLFKPEGREANLLHDNAKRIATTLSKRGIWHFFSQQKKEALFNSISSSSINDPPEEVQNAPIIGVKPNRLATDLRPNPFMKNYIQEEIAKSQVRELFQDNMNLKKELNKEIERFNQLGVSTEKDRIIADIQKQSMELEISLLRFWTEHLTSKNCP